MWGYLGRRLWDCALSFFCSLLPGCHEVNSLVLCHVSASHPHTSGMILSFTICQKTMGPTSGGWTEPKQMFPTLLALLLFLISGCLAFLCSAVISSPTPQKLSSLPPSRTRSVVSNTVHNFKKKEQEIRRKGKAEKESPKIRKELQLLSPHILFLVLRSRLLTGRGLGAAEEFPWGC